MSCRHANECVGGHTSEVDYLRFVRVRVWAGARMSYINKDLLAPVSELDRIRVGARVKM